MAANDVALAACWLCWRMLVPLPSSKQASWNIADHRLTGLPRCPRCMKGVHQRAPGSHLGASHLHEQAGVLFQEGKQCNMHLLWRGALHNMSHTADWSASARACVRVHVQWCAAETIPTQGQHNGTCRQPEGHTHRHNHSGWNSQDIAYTLLCNRR